MKILYLDQNKWVDLAKANSYPQNNYMHSLALAKIRASVESEKLVIPLSASNIYETQKINDRLRREAIAKVQATLSKGYVFRCGSSRLRQELQVFLRNLHGSTLANSAEKWFLSDFFLDAFAERSALRNQAHLVNFALSLNQMNPVMAVYSYLTDLPDEERKQAVRAYSASSADLKRLIEQRKERLEGQGFSIHRRVYQATLMIDHIEEILMIATNEGFKWRSVSDIGPKILKRLASELPYFSVETELAVKLERSHHALNENDFRDMLSICAVVPYSNFVVMEKAFASLAIQAKLDSKFETKILTSISDLNAIL